MSLKQITDSTETKPMNDKTTVFLDTNLLIYAHTTVEILKQQQVQQIIIDENTVISTQVFKEVANVLYKKFGFSWEDVQKVLENMEQNNEVHSNTFNTVQTACKIAQRYDFSFYDSLIVAAALESSCSILYSEDLHHQQVIEKTLTVINPFSK